MRPVLGAREVVDLVRLYETLGFVVVFQDDLKNPKYAGIQRGEVQLHIQRADAEQWAYPIDRPASRVAIACNSIARCDLLTGQLRVLSS